MLELKVLRVYHSGDKEAKKLLPYIKECDLFCSEEAFLTEEAAARVEAELQLKYKGSRTNFHNWASTLLQNDNEQERAYLLRKFDYLYVSKVPVWHLERFTDEEARKAREYMNKAETLMNEAGRKLEKGHIEECVKMYFDGMKIELEGVRYRDDHIGGNISIMDQKVRQIYPSISDQRQLRVAMDIGGLHRPDKYTSMLLTMIDLRGKPENPIQALWYDFDEHKTLEEMKRLILARCLWAIFQNSPQKHKAQNLMDLSFDELSSIARND